MIFVLWNLNYLNEQLSDTKVVLVLRFPPGTSRGFHDTDEVTITTSIPTRQSGHRGHRGTRRLRGDNLIQLLKPMQRWKTKAYE